MAIKVHGESDRDWAKRELQDLLPMLKHAHFTNIRIRIGGEWKEVEGDWLKYLAS